MKRVAGSVLILLLAVCVLFSGCLRYSSNLLEVTRAVPQSNYDIPSTTVPVYTQQDEPSTLTPAVTTPVPTAASESTTVPPVTQAVPQTTAPAPSLQPETTTQGEKDPSQWTKDEIVATLNKSINTAKAFTGSLTVEHTEEFQMDITKCPGGSMGLNVANSVASGFLKPTTETLQYNGGTAVDKDGKTVPILLPKRSNFSLTSAGVKSARAFKSGANTVIEITLISENATLDAPPKVNAGAIGYLDVNEVDLSFVNIKAFNVEYKGSTMIVNLDAQGKVVSISYDVPVTVVASGSALGISGEISLNGEEKEVWKLNW